MKIVKALTNLYIFLSNINLCYTFTINVINLPYDLGANKQGSRHAFSILKNDLINSININEIIELTANSKDLRNELLNAYIESLKSLNSDKIPLLIGGDHTSAIPNIFASNNFCITNNERLGVLWIDAHADFNTMQTSETKNIHGMPVSILCGHTLQNLTFDEYLEPSQFLYYGVRDIDTIELDRFKKYNMKLLYNPYELKAWLQQFDKIHISFDMDSLDPTVFSSVNTPIKNGLTLANVAYLFNYIRNSTKLQSLDIVEYNPTLGNQNSVIVQLLKELFY